MFPYTLAEINAMATDAVRGHIAIPGIQPKLSLHLDRDTDKGNGRFTIVGLQGDFIFRQYFRRFGLALELGERQLENALRRSQSNLPAAL